ncbi:MAG TPA: FAD-dependent thymidylate synthase, partial [Chloroflexota bacterium]|nr:FAD-dependent thymidylate synthase [Chloroflexota bacterium]
MGQAESTERLPIDEDNQRYAPFYVPERFTAEEQRLLAPFFSNLDRPVFVIYNLPEEVIGALSSRYSRSTKSLRRTFLDEYVLPLREGKATGGARKGDARASPSGVSDQGIWQNQLAEIVDVQRGRKFFDRWLAQYGDDSIAEMGGIHLCLEGISNIATVEVEDKRIGISPLEKSSRYVSFLDRRDDGEYRYVVPGELRGTPHERQYRQAMDSLFAAFAEISEPYLAYLYQKFPRGEDETEASFRGSRSAKRFDDLRDLLPFATQTNLALFGNGRAFEDLINRLLDHPIGELRWLGQAITSELERVVPSFIRRVRTRRGADVQIYRAGLRALREELANAALGADRPRARSDSWAELVSATPDADIEVLSAFVFGGAEGIPFDEVRRAVAAMTPEQRADLFQRVLAARDVNDPSAGRAEVRFRKVPRAFENARYLFALWARGGDYRDLHRHRLLTQERQRFTTRLGYDL